MLADRVPYYTGSGTAALATFTAAGRTLAGAADAAAQRGALGLGTMAQQDANAVAITGGSATGLSAVGATNANVTNLNVGAGALTAEQMKVSFSKSGGVHGLTMHGTGADTGSYTMLFLNAAAAIVGSIATTATATTYATSSDARLKHAITPLTGALDVVRALRPVSFLWNADDSEGRGFVASEVQQVAPEAVSGEPDAVDAEGQIVPQGLDMSKLVPYLVGAVQALAAQVQVLTARLDAQGG